MSETSDSHARDAAPLARLQGVVKWYGREQVLKGVDLTVARNEVTVLLGRNGSGKSTALKILAGLLPRDGGEAHVFGKDCEDLCVPERERLVYLTDALGASPVARVHEELALVRRIRGARWKPEREKELVDRFQVPLQKRLSALSKGQKTRLMLVMALASDPELLILDEPALGLDLFGRNDLLEAIIDTSEKDGAGVVLATHIVEDVERIADRIVFIHDGLAPVSGTLDELRDSYRQARFLLGPEGAFALEKAATELLGIRRIARDRDGPEDERVVIVDGPEVTKVLEERSGARCLEVRRLTLREIYFFVLEKQGATA